MKPYNMRCVHDSGARPEMTFEKQNPTTLFRLIRCHPDSFSNTFSLIQYYTGFQCVWEMYTTPTRLLRALVYAL